MAKASMAELPAKLYEFLSPLSADERSRVVQATMILFGEDGPLPSTPSPATSAAGGAMPKALPNDAGAFLDEKAPKNKGEILAVAARFRELTQGEETHSKADLKAVVTEARRNFDDNNFARDINNAKRQAGFFNLGTGRNVSKLSYYGQQFVDVLPDREAASKLKKPKVGGNRKKAAKKRGGANKTKTKKQADN